MSFTLAAIALTSPLWLWALCAAAGVPLLAHLLNRLHGRVAVFPTVRFFEQAAAQGRRRVQVRDWLLLALRALALALVVLAFVRPVWRAGGAGMGAEGPADRVFVLDVSASMSRTDRGAALINHAKAATIDACEAASARGDRVLVVLAGTMPHALLPEPTRHVSELVRRIRDVTVTHESADLDSAIDQGLRRCAVSSHSTQPRRVRVDIFSDMQRGVRWSPRDGIDVVVHRIGRSAANLALTRPRVWPLPVIAGQRATVSVDLVNHSDGPATAGVAMRFGDTVQTTIATVGPDASTTVTFGVHPAHARLAELTFHLQDHSDGLRLDDRTGMFVNVASSRNVALVTRSPVNDRGRAAYFIVRALGPDSRPSPALAPGADPGLAMAGVRLMIWSPQTLLQQLARDDRRAPILVLHDIGSLDEAIINTLSEYLTRGGGVFWLAHRSDTASIAALLVAAGVHDSPALQWRDNPAMHIARGRFDAPMLSVFSGSAQAALRRQVFRSVLCGLPGNDSAIAPAFTVTGDDDDVAGTGLLGQWRPGAGRLAIWAADLAPHQSDFVRHALFVPVLHQVLRDLSPTPLSEPDVRSGQRLLVAVNGHDVGMAFTARGPNGAMLPLALTAHRDVFDLGLAANVGRHVIVNQRDALVAGRYVHLDSGESELRIANAQTPHGNARANERADVGIGVINHLETDTALWPWLLIAAMGVFVIEQRAALLWTEPYDVV